MPPFVLCVLCVLCVLGKIVELTGARPTDFVRMFVTNTLANSDDDDGWIPGMLAASAPSACPRVRWAISSRRPRSRDLAADWAPGNVPGAVET